MALGTLLKVVVLTACSGSLTLWAQTQENQKPKFRVESVTMSPAAIHLEEKNGPTCATAVVRVALAGSQSLGPTKPWLRVFLVEYSSDPPGVKVNINDSKYQGSAFIDRTLDKPEDSFSFKICATGDMAGKFTLQATIFEVRPAAEYDKQEPNPISGRSEFELRK